jgi:hypothetical protein
VQVDLKARAATGTPITIFGHPQARPLEWSQTCVLEDAFEFQASMASMRAQALALNQDYAPRLEKIFNSHEHFLKNALEIPVM